MSDKIFSGVKGVSSKGYAYCNDSTILLVDHFIRRLDWRLLSALILLAAMSLLAATLLAQSPFQTEIFTPEQISYLSMPDTRIQSTFYRIFSASVFIFALTFGLIAPAWFSHRSTSSMQISSHLPAWFIPWFGITFWVLILAIYEPKVRDFLLALAVAYLAKETIKGRFQTKTLFVTFIVICLIYYLLPLIFSPKIIDGRLWTMDVHWSAVLGDGLAENLLKFEAFSGYGILLSEVVAKSRAIPFFSSLSGTQALLIVFDIAFVGLIMLVIISRIGKDNFRMILLSTLLILVLFCGMLSGIFQRFDTPNILPIRFIMIPFTILLAYYLGGLRTIFGGVVCGLAAPLLIFYNFETGLFCILALGFAFFVKGFKDGLLTLLSSGLAAVFAFVISGIALTLLLFDQPVTSVISELMNLSALKMQSGSSGYGGLSFYIFVPFILVMSHVMVIFARQLVSIRDGKAITSAEFQTIVIVALIVATGPYIMNRFHVNKMWIPFLLYFFLVLPNLVNGKTVERAIWSFMIIVFVAPFIFGNPTRFVFSKEAFTSVSQRMEGKLKPCIDGIPASPELCQYSLEKAEELKSFTATYPGFKWLSGLSLTMSRLSKSQPALDKKAVFFFAHREETRKIVLDEIIALQSPFVVFDNVTKGNVAGIPEVVEQFQRNLLVDAGYEVIAETGYWTVARKKGS